MARTIFHTWVIDMHLHARILCNLISALLISAAAAEPVVAESDRALLLNEKYKSLEPSLSQNQLSPPLVIESYESGKRLGGDIYARSGYSFDMVSRVLADPRNWCDILLLHINTKLCRNAGGNTPTLQLYVGKESQQDVEEADLVEFRYAPVAAAPDYLSVLLTAEEGPLGTSAYRILLEAIRLPNEKTFFHLSFSFSANYFSLLAMKAYLGTVAGDQVGFTVVGRDSGGDARYIRGVRGLMERNTMRYYLAMDAFLGAVDSPPAIRTEKRMQDWFSAIERYPRQLHEVDRAAYMTMKRAEHERQQRLNKN